MSANPASFDAASVADRLDAIRLQIARADRTMARIDTAIAAAAGLVLAGYVVAAALYLAS